LSSPLSALAAVAAAFAGSDDIDRALPEALRAALAALGLEAGGIYLVDEESGELRATPHHFGLPPDYPREVARFQRGEAAIGRALGAVSPVVVADIASSPDAREATRRSGLRSVVFVPLRARGRAVGLMPVGAYVLREFTEEDIAFLGTVGGMVGAAVDSARLAERSRRHLAQVQTQLTLLAGASEIAASTLDVDALLGSIARYVQRSFGYYSVSIYLVRPEGREAHLAGAAGAAASVMPKGHRMPFGTGMIGWVSEHGQHILANDVRREPRFVASALGATLSELAVPVRLTGEVVAVLNVESDRLDAFDEGDVVALDGIAAQVASAIQNARLFDEKVRALRNLEILQEITNVLNSDLELDVLLERIARRSVEAVRPAQMGAVLLYDGEALRVRSSYGYPHPKALDKVSLAFHEALPGSVFVAGHGRLVGSGAFERRRPARHPAFREAAGGVDPRSALCVPIVLPQEKLGVLLLESTTGPEDFSIDDLRFASTLAAQAAIAIGNALQLRRILEMDRQRQEYLSNVSHELRTPLTVIQGYLEALADGSAGDQAGHYLRITREQAQRLGRMIDEVLHLSRLEQGLAQRHVQWAPVSLPEVVRGVLQGQRQEAAARGLQVAAAVKDGVPVLAGDERLLQSLVFHLVENAVKFTDGGGRVEVGLAAEAEEIVLKVQDDGIGIAPEFHERIFEKFFMVDASPAKQHAGAGIGLFLVREVVAIHGGTIRVESAPGRGSTFEVRLPLRPSD